MLLYEAIHRRPWPNALRRLCVAEYWHPQDQDDIYALRFKSGEQIRSLAFWCGADADSISDASLYEVSPTIASDHFMWGGIDMEAAS